MTASLRSMKTTNWVIVASLGAGGPTAFTYADLVERRPAHARVEAIPPRHEVPGDDQDAEGEIDFNDFESAFFSESDDQGAIARLQVRTTGASRFELDMDLHVDPPPGYNLELTDDDPDEAGLLAIEQPGILSIHSRSLGLVEGASIRIIDTVNDHVMSFVLDMELVTLEVHLDPGLYRLLIEGTLDAGGLQKEGERSRTVSSPGTMLLLGGMLTGLRRRRS